MKSHKFPPVTQELVTALREYFPDRIPDKSGDKDLRELVAEQRVIRFLQSIHDDQNNI